MYALIEDYLDGSLEAGPQRLTVADGMITYATSGDALSADARANLDRAIEQLASGEIQPPRTPTGEVTDRNHSDTGRAPVPSSSPTFRSLHRAGRLGGLGRRGVFKGPAQYRGWSVIWKGGTGDPLFGVTFWTIDNLLADNCSTASVPFDPAGGSDRRRARRSLGGHAWFQRHRADRHHRRRVQWKAS